jgi:3-hydroxybutyryl-CoA dehydrogenase
VTGVDPASGPPVAVIGAGRMGTAIAYVFAATGHEVALSDTSATALDRARGELERIATLRGERPVEVRRCTRLADAAPGAELVIEAVPEQPQLKRHLLAQLSGLVGSGAILATNTSAIPIRELADVVTHPERVIGTHFWNPPYAVELVEVIQAPATAPAVVTRTMELLRGARMAPVHVRRDVPGFVGNRLQHALKREAIALVASGVCDAETVDTVTKLGFGRRMAVLGPLEQSDLVGLDLTLAIHETLMPELDTTAVPHPYLVQKVARGELGMKTGCGFRSWTPDEARAARERLDRHLLGLNR